MESNSLSPAKGAPFFIQFSNSERALPHATAPAFLVEALLLRSSSHRLWRSCSCDTRCCSANDCTIESDLKNGESRWFFPTQEEIQMTQYQDVSRHIWRFRKFIFEDLSKCDRLGFRFCTTSGRRIYFWIGYDILQPKLSNVLHFFVKGLWKPRKRIQLWQLWLYCGHLKLEDAWWYWRSFDVFASFAQLNVEILKHKCDGIHQRSRFRHVIGTEGRMVSHEEAVLLRPLHSWLRGTSFANQLFLTSQFLRSILYCQADTPNLQ